MANSGRFSAENQPSKKRGKAARGRIIDALGRCKSSETDFLDAVINSALAGDVPLMKEVLVRLHPTPKSSYEPVVFEFPANGTPAQKADALAQAVADGVISVDIASQMVNIIKSGLEITEITELMQRIEILETRLARAEDDED